MLPLSKKSKIRNKISSLIVPLISKENKDSISSYNKTELGSCVAEHFKFYIHPFYMYSRNINTWFAEELFQLKILRDINEHIGKFMHDYVSPKYRDKFKLDEIYYHFSNDCGFNYFKNKTKGLIKFKSDDILAAAIVKKSNEMDDKDYVDMLLELLEEGWNTPLYKAKALSGKLISMDKLLGTKLPEKDETIYISKEQMFLKNMMIFVDVGYYLLKYNQFVWMSRRSREKAIEYLELFLEFMYFTLYNNDEGYLGTKFDKAFVK